MALGAISRQAEVKSSETLERGTKMVRDPTTGAIWDSKFYFMANTGIESLDDGKIVDLAKLEAIANCGLNR